MRDDRHSTSLALQSFRDEADRRAQFSGLLVEHTSRLYGYILTLVPNPADADEILQDVSTVLWQRFDEFQADSNFGAWGCRVAYYKALHFLRHRKVQRAAFSSTTVEMLEAEMSVVDDTLSSEYKALADCLSELREADRDLIVLRYGKNGTPQILSEMFGRPVKAIYNSLDRIRRTLFQCVMGKLAAGE
jgi:RNA polymerase sigma-70 factor, ECF subfamily